MSTPAASVASDLRRRRAAAVATGLPGGDERAPALPADGSDQLPGALSVPRIAPTAQPNLRDFMQQNLAATALPLPGAAPRPSVAASGAAPFRTPPVAAAGGVKPVTFANPNAPVQSAAPANTASAPAGADDGFSLPGPEGYTAPETASNVDDAAAAARVARAQPINLRAPTATTRVFDPTGSAALNPLGAPTYQQPALPGAIDPNAAPATAAAVPPGPLGKVGAAVGAALPGGLSVPGGPTQLPTMTVSAPAVPKDLQSMELVNRGVPLDQQTDTAIGGDGSGDNAAAVRRAAIRGGTAPGQNVRLGYDKTSRIYGTSSRAGGPIDTFTGVGVADPNNPTTNIDGNSAVAANKVGLGITPTQSAAAAQYREDLANGRALPGAIALPYNPADDVATAIRDRNSDLASVLNRDPRSALGTAARNLTLDLSSRRNRTSRYAYGGQSPAEIATGSLIGAIGQDFGARTNAAVARARNDTTLAGIGARADASRDVAATRAGATEYSADARAGAARDVATTKANTPKVNAAETKLFHDSYATALKVAKDNGLSDDDAQAHASELASNAVFAYRKTNANAGAAGQKPTLAGFKAYAKQQGTKMSDADLEKAFNERYGSGAQ